MTVADLQAHLGAPGTASPVGAKSAQAKEVLDLFCAHFERDQGTAVFLGFVPGRIELLGKHTDYAGGHSLLCSLDRGFVVAAAPNQEGRVHLVEDREEIPPVNVPLDPGIEPRAGTWENYPMTVARRLARNFPEVCDGRGVDVAFSSDLPSGSGMSGSSALMVMVFAALAESLGVMKLDRFRRNVADGLDLAMYLACMENGQSFRELEGDAGVGTFGGSEDHTAILMCREQIASVYRFAPTVWRADLAWPTEWAVAVCYSGVRAEKTAGAMEAYNHLASRARAVVEAAGEGVSTIREALAAESHSPGEIGPNLVRKLVAAVLPEEEGWDLQERVSQFALEDEVLIPRALQALLAGDGAEFGRIISESHRASRQFLKNIAPEVEFLCTEAPLLGAWGASGFGAGFGGSAYAVLGAGEARAFEERWRRAYRDRFPRAFGEASFLTTRPSGGAQAWSRIDGGDAPRRDRWVDTLF